MSVTHSETDISDICRKSVSILYIFTNNATVALIAPRRFLSTVDNPDKKLQICVCVNQVQTGDEKKPCEESEVRFGSVGGTEPVI